MKAGRILVTERHPGNDDIPPSRDEPHQKSEEAYGVMAVPRSFLLATPGFRAEAARCGSRPEFHRAPRLCRTSRILAMNLSFAPAWLPEVCVELTEWVHESTQTTPGRREAVQGICLTGMDIGVADSPNSI
jgi:hypothetical protein